MKEKIINGCIVMAISGREKNNIYMVLNKENQFVYLVNGKSRPLNAPKKKNIKHIIFKKSDNNLANKINNKSISDSDIIKTLKEYKSFKKSQEAKHCQNKI